MPFLKLSKLQYEENYYERGLDDSLAIKLAAVERTVQHSSQKAWRVTYESYFENLSSSSSTDTSYTSEDKYLTFQNCALSKYGEEIEQNGTDWDYSLSLDEGTKNDKLNGTDWDYSLSLVKEAKQDEHNEQS